MKKNTYAADRMFPSILECKYNVHPVGHTLHHSHNDTPCCSSIQRIPKDKLLQSGNMNNVISKSILLWFSNFQSICRSFSVQVETFKTFIKHIPLVIENNRYQTAMEKSFFSNLLQSDKQL